MLSYISLHRGAPKRVKACQITWGNYRAWSGAIYWNTTSSPSCPASLSTRAMTWPSKFVLLIYCPLPFNLKFKIIQVYVYTIKNSFEILLKFMKTFSFPSYWTFLNTKILTLRWHINISIHSVSIVCTDKFTSSKFLW